MRSVIADSHWPPALRADAICGMRTRSKHAADTRYVTAFTPSTFCELNAAMPTPLSVDPAMTPRLEVIWSSALAAVHWARGTRNGTGAITSGPNTVETLERTKTSTNSRARGHDSGGTTQG